MCFECINLRPSAISLNRHAGEHGDSLLKLIGNNVRADQSYLLAIIKSVMFENRIKCWSFTVFHDMAYPWFLFARERIFIFFICFNVFDLTQSKVSSNDKG